MRVRSRWHQAAVLTTAAAGLAWIGYTAGRGLGRHRAHAGSPAPLPLTLSHEPGAAEAATLDDATEGIVLAQRKRVMGRLRSLEQVRQVATQIRPMIDRALDEPAAYGDLQALSARAGMSVPQYKAYFAGKQEADLLLESGGDPNARSVSNAIGVAQFMVGTGQRCGLRVNIGASNVLSRRIAALESQIAAAAQQPEGWTKQVPPNLRHVTPPSPRKPAGSGFELFSPPPAHPSDVWTRDQWIAYQRQQWDNLVAQRRQVDERFDAAKAVRAQTRYLLRLTRRFGSVDWTLQAYHGGEAGVSKEIGLFLSAARGRLASRGSYGGGGSVPYSDVYRNLSPNATPAAFSYIFGRSDDHRYYWWKALMAERALELYRKDPQEFERQWQALRPGENADAAFYGDAENLQFADPQALRAAYHAGELVQLPRRALALGVRTANVAALEPESTPLQKGLRPEAMGTLARIAEIYRSQRGRQPLVLTAMVQSTEYREKWNAKYPAKPLPPGVPRDPEFHTTGLAFDLAQPTGDWDRKVLEYSLGRLYDTLKISWRKENAGGAKRYHVVVNPAFKDEMIGAYQKAAR